MAEEVCPSPALVFNDRATNLPLQERAILVQILPRSYQPFPAAFNLHSPQSIRNFKANPYSNLDTSMARLSAKVSLATMATAPIAQAVEVQPTSVPLVRSPRGVTMLKSSQTRQRVRVKKMHIFIRAEEERGMYILRSTRLQRILKDLRIN